MLVGRRAEQELLECLLQEARSGRGGALTMRGEAGIGKTTLLEHAVEHAAGLRVLHALGVEAEAELPFATVHELVRPILPFLDDLPEPQSASLKAALALVPADGDGVDRFAAYAATLGLLAAAAAEQPVLCVVDDAHWLDDASAEALVFAARRIRDEAILMLFAARDPAAATFTSPGVAELRLRGLAPDEARALLAAGAPAVPTSARERLVEIADGNPLALIEFGSALAGAEDREDVSEPLPVGDAVARSFLERSSRLSAATRRALLFAAAGDPAEPDAIWAALAAEGIAFDAVAEAQREGLLARGRRFDFCHPLARSAIYQAAPAEELRSAHARLAETTQQSERGAWHLAAAACGPDEQVALALERAAAEAGKRGGVSAQARALERAAGLTADAEARARRLFAAARAAEAAGRLERAESLLADTAELTADPELRADAVARRSYLLFDRGELDRALEVANAEAERAAPQAAARVLTASGIVHALVHRLDIPAALATAERAAALVGPRLQEDLDLCHALVWTWTLSGRRRDALALVGDCRDRVEIDTILAIDFGVDFLQLEEYVPAREVLDSVVFYAREAGAITNLSYALEQHALLELRTGNLTASYAAALESVQLAEALGNDVALASSLAKLALVEAISGRGDDARAHAAHALEVTSERGDGYNAVRARAALGLEALVRGDAGGAAEWLAPAVAALVENGVRHPNNFRVHADLIEAQVRAGQRAEAAATLHRLEADAELTGSPWAAAAAARSRALLGDDCDVLETFEQALRLHEDVPDDLERARTRLHCGEHLRRLQRRRECREHLHEALDTFARLGARPWEHRARAELRASGERLRRRAPVVDEQLTPQELQIALAAAEGLTNKEIAARLFLSPKTVEFHLGHAYRKLNVRSRGELIKLFAVQAAPVARLQA